MEQLEQTSLRTVDYFFKMTPALAKVIHEFINRTQDFTKRHILPPSFNACEKINVCTKQLNERTYCNCTPSESPRVALKFVDGTVIKLEFFDGTGDGSPGEPEDRSPHLGITILPTQEKQYLVERNLLKQCAPLYKDSEGRMNYGHLVGNQCLVIGPSSPPPEVSIFESTFMRLMFAYYQAPARDLTPEFILAWNNARVLIQHKLTPPSEMHITSLLKTVFA